MSPTSLKLEVYRKLQEHHHSETIVQAFMRSHFFQGPRKLDNFQKDFELNMQYVLFIFTLVLLLSYSLVCIHPNITCRPSNILCCCYCKKVKKSIQWFWIVLHLGLAFKCSVTWIFQRTQDCETGHCSLWSKTHWPGSSKVLSQLHYK